MDANALLYMAHVTREATHGESLVGTYYAYLTAHGINQLDSGHLAARRVFDSPDIDFLMSPPNYSYRKRGETSIYSSAMQLPPALMRNIARSAGVHIWLDSDDALYTDGQYVGLHAATACTKTVRLPSPCRVFNTRSGQAITTDGLTVSIPLKQAETALLRLETP